jgi:molybdopterin-guanine dinucleotide biosynthesis protein A
MGTDKAWLVLGGATIIERVITALKPVTESLAIIANDDQYRRLGLPVISDEHEGLGPIEAIRMALTHSRYSRVVLVGCDLPFVTSEFLDYLLKRSGGADSVVPVSSEGRAQPLCAVYSTAVIETVTRLIEERKFKVMSLLEAIETRFIGFEEIREMEGAELFFENVNTPQDYARATERVRRERGL